MEDKGQFTGGMFPEEEYQEHLKNTAADIQWKPSPPIITTGEVIGDIKDCMPAEPVELSTSITQEPTAGLAALLFIEEVNKLLAYAQARTIETSEDMDLATHDLAIISVLKKTIDAKKKEYLKPLKAQEDEINFTFKMVADPLIEADKITREKIMACITAQKEARRKQEEINTLKMQAAKAEMELKGELSEDINLVKVAPEAPKHIYTESGTATVKERWTWELEDFALLPDEYKMPDSSKIGRLVRAGMRTIPGCRIYNVEGLQITTPRGHNGKA